MRRSGPGACGRRTESPRAGGRRFAARAVAGRPRHTANGPGTASEWAFVRGAFRVSAADQANGKSTCHVGLLSWPGPSPQRQSNDAPPDHEWPVLWPRRAGRSTAAANDRCCVVRRAAIRRSVGNARFRSPGTRHTAARSGGRRSPPRPVVRPEPAKLRHPAPPHRRRPAPLRPRPQRHPAPSPPCLRPAAAPVCVRPQGTGPARHLYPQHRVVGRTRTTPGVRDPFLRARSGGLKPYGSPAPGSVLRARLGRAGPA
ncbi:hypothetical protein SUDANB120_00425 [Streptomyces sp. enrichment culture]